MVTIFKKWILENFTSGQCLQSADITLYIESNTFRVKEKY